MTKPWYVSQAEAECVAQIKAERDPIWKRHLIEERKLLSREENWERLPNGDYQISIPCWDMMIGILGSEASVIEYFEKAAELP